MLEFINPKFVALAQIIMAIGFIRFWFKWYRKKQNEPWFPAGFIEHERAFVYPDTVLTVLMIIAGCLILLDNPLGRSLTLICGGMMLFLSIIDLAYLTQNKLLTKKNRR